MRSELILALYETMIVDIDSEMSVLSIVRNQKSTMVDEGRVRVASSIAEPLGIFEGVIFPCTYISGSYIGVISVSVISPRHFAPSLLFIQNTYIGKKEGVVCRVLKIEPFLYCLRIQVVSQGTVKVVF